MTGFRLGPNGTYDWVDGGRRVLQGACGQVIYRDVAGDCKKLQTTKTADQVLIGTDENVQVSLRLDRETAGLDVKNLGPEPIRIDRLDVLSCEESEGGTVAFSPASELAFLEHGWQSWSPVRVRTLGLSQRDVRRIGATKSSPSAMTGDSSAIEGYSEKHQPHGSMEPGEAASEWFTLIGRPGTSNARLLGFITAADQLSEIKIKTLGEKITGLAAVCYGDGVELSPGQTLDSEKLWLTSGEPRALVEAYASRLGSEMGARTALPSLAGWCSWYYYYGENSEADVRVNLDRIRDEKLPMQLMLIDDGYETAIGDWLSIRSEKFPGGMRKAADDIRSAGMIPGLWLAPFGVAQNSQVAAQHPGFLLRNQEGQPVVGWHHWSEPIYSLDLTHPAVEEHFRQLFQTVCFEWGYDLLKLDFLFAGALAGNRYDASTTRAQAFRRGLQIIREAIGEKKWILGCGAPQGPSVGIVDAMRVGQDVSISWQPVQPDPSSPSTFLALQNSLVRAPFHRRLWVNDNDCVLVRKRGNLNLMTRNETRTLATIAALSGGLVLDSDNLTELNADRLNDLRRILPPDEHEGQVEDYFDSTQHPPQRLVRRFSREWGEWEILAVINWGAQRQTSLVELPMGRAFHVYDFWKKKYLGTHRHQMRLDQGRHETTVLVLSEVSNAPKIIASSFHISSGCGEIRRVEIAKRTLAIELEAGGRQRGELLFALSRRSRDPKAIVNGRRVTVHRIRDGVVGVRFFHREGERIILSW